MFNYELRIPGSRARPLPNRQAPKTGEAFRLLRHARLAPEAGRVPGEWGFDPGSNVVFRKQEIWCDTDPDYPAFHFWSPAVQLIGGLERPGWRPAEIAGRCWGLVVKSLRDMMRDFESGREPDEQYRFGGWPLIKPADLVPHGRGGTAIGRDNTWEWLRGRFEMTDACNADTGTRQWRVRPDRVRGPAA